MKKRIGACLALMALAGVGALASCGESGVAFDENASIKLFSRAAGSGTHECFFESIGYKDVAKEDKWNASAVVATSATNPDMMHAVSIEPYGIGYCSLDSLETASGIKGLDYEGVKASVQTVVDGTYKISRNFNFVIRDYEDKTSSKSIATYAYVDFLLNSLEGHTAIKSAGGILEDRNDLTPWSELAKNYQGIDTNNVEIDTCGSTSVLGVLGKTSSKFSELTKNKVTFKLNQQSSGAAVSGVTATSGTLYDIGFLSREIQSAEVEKLNENNIRGAFAKDAVVPIVNEKNTALTNITGDVLKKMYQGEIKTWKEAKESL